MPLLAIHFFRWPIDRFLSPSVARTLGHVFAWNHVVSLAATDFPVGGDAKKKNVDQPER